MTILGDSTVALLIAPMKYRDLQIQTQREFPNNARTPGFGWLVRAGYMTRENEILPLGRQVIERLQELSARADFLIELALPVLHSQNSIFFPLNTGAGEVVHCESCNYTQRLELAQFKKTALPHGGELAVEKVLTPDCNTIEALCNFLGLPKEKTAKALMYTRPADHKFIFIVVRGDMQLSEAKLKEIAGEVRAATPDEIARSGAVPGYASPIGLKDALIIVDDLIPNSENLAAGANQAGYHFKNTNFPRDYSAEIITDVVQARAGDTCIRCGHTLSILSVLELSADAQFHWENILLALAETHHDDKGLIFPGSAAPFEVHLLHLAAKEMDTLAKAGEIYNQLQGSGFTVLFDDRDERAGVKFNDADLIGCTARITVGEKNLKAGMVELKLRSQKDNQIISLEDLVSHLKKLFR
jgi:prolyl-tRNA synthetase